ncbi:glycoside hydrolase superfamily [Gorgonomyces haynaldii]|nr:glycoside hydrolase superfamily [Gorgonomyces haynaldii]
MLSLLLSLVQAQAVDEPSKVLIGAWLDTADSAPGALDGDRPVKFNERMGFKASVFQYAQNIPIDTYPFPYEQITDTNSDAYVFLTVYPRPSPWTVTDEQITNLTLQMKKINDGGRRVLMRFAPEMNGNWNYYGQQPTQFLSLWRRVFTALRRDAPLTALVWAPSSGNGYPYTNLTPTGSDLALLDTNKDGVVNNLDDPYSPYYPGDDQVDWVGVSIYTYGTQFPWVDNIAAPAGKFETILNQGGFYQTYAVQRKKPVMIAETAATYHTKVAAGATELVVKQSWWRQYITNSTFLDTYSRIKLICMFEFRKDEEVLLDGSPDNRDFRISNKSEIRNAFLQDFEQVKSKYLFAGTGQLTGSTTTPQVTSTPTKSDAYGLIVHLFPILFILFINQ